MVEHLPLQFKAVAAYAVLALAVLTVVVHLALAWAVLDDARRLAIRGKSTLFVNGVIWSFAVLCGG